jgi:ribosomal protein S18 acetylase RimI-like enzyme
LYSKNKRAINFFRKNGFNYVFQNKRMYGSDPASLLIKRRFQKSIKMVNELEFEEGLG